MMGITSEEQNKVKRMKELRIVLETPGTVSNVPTFELYVSQNKKRKRNVMRKFLKRL